jgi:uncharacterized membrane protein (Fun14 family)
MNAMEQKAVGVLTRWTGNGPWRANSVLAAVAIILVGVWSWFSDIQKGGPPSATIRVVTNAQNVATASSAEVHWNWHQPLPAYARVSASYVAGFCLGWFFRKLARLILVVVTLLIMLLAYGKFVGMDTTHAQTEVKRGGAWAQHEAATAENYFMHLLPSAAGGGVGTFLGFRRRNSNVAPSSAG